MYSRFSAAVRFSAPPLETRFRGPACRPCVRVPRSLLRTPEEDRPRGHPHQRPQPQASIPDSDQVARDVVAFGETVECLARNEVQGDLSFELDAMDAVLGHGFHPLKARQRRSIPNLANCPPSQGAFHSGYTHPCRTLRGARTMAYTVPVIRWGP